MRQEPDMGVWFSWLCGLLVKMGLNVGGAVDGVVVAALVLLLILGLLFHPSTVLLVPMYSRRNSF